MGEEPERRSDVQYRRVQIAEQINASISAAPKYVVVVAPGQTGLPPSAHTVMFLTRSYTEKQRAVANSTISHENGRTSRRAWRSARRSRRG